MHKKATVVLAALLMTGSLSAAPALWYKWRSKLNGAEFCAQVSPGDAWEKLPEAYKNARCEAREPGATANSSR